MERNNSQTTFENKLRRYWILKTFDRVQVFLRWFLRTSFLANTRQLKCSWICIFIKLLLINGSLKLINKSPENIFPNACKKLHRSVRIASLWLSTNESRLITDFRGIFESDAIKTQYFPKIAKNGFWINANIRKCRKQVEEDNQHRRSAE